MKRIICRPFHTKTKKKSQLTDWTGFSLFRSSLFISEILLMSNWFCFFSLTLSFMLSVRTANKLTLKGGDQRPPIIPPRCVSVKGLSFPASFGILFFFSQNLSFQTQRWWKPKNLPGSVKILEAQRLHDMQYWPSAVGCSPGSGAGSSAGQPPPPPPAVKCSPGRGGLGGAGGLQPRAGGWPEGTGRSCWLPASEAGEGERHAPIWISVQMSSVGLPVRCCGPPVFSKTCPPPPPSVLSESLEISSPAALKQEWFQPIVCLPLLTSITGRGGGATSGRQTPHFKGWPRRRARRKKERETGRLINLKGCHWRASKNYIKKAGFLYQSLGEDLGQEKKIF